MFDKREHRLLYQVRYEIKGTEAFGKSDVWPLIIGKYYDWVSRKRDSGLRAVLNADLVNLYADDPNAHYKRSVSASFARGELSYTSERADGYELKTAALFEPGGGDWPRYWAMETVQPDKKYSSFKWVTRVGITSLVKRDGMTRTGSHVVNITTHSRIGSSSLGWSPQSIAERPQQVASMLFELGCLEIGSGSAMLTGCPIELLPEDIDTLVRVLTDPMRDFPVVVMASQPYTCIYPAVPSDLARELRESAVVYLLCEQDQELLRAYTRRFPWEGGFACPDGCARIYLPRVNLSNRSDARRHLVFGEREMRGEGLWKFIGRVRRFATISCRKRSGEVASPDDIAEMVRSRRAAERLEHLNDLRALHALNEQEALERMDDPIVVSLTEETILWDELVTGIEEAGASAFDAHEATGHLERIEALESEVAECMDLADSLEGEIDRLNEQINANEADLAYYRYRVAELERGDASHIDDTADRVAAAMLELRRFPRSMADVVELASRAYSGRLVFLPEAIASAESCDKDGSNAFVDELWRMLTAMAIDLWPLHFEESSIDVRAAFESTTGWALAVNEGSATRASRDMMMLRQRMYKNRKIMVTAHVKGKQQVGEKTLRVHYATDNDDCVLVIGHCGWHLESMSTNHR